jgi:integrase
MIRYWRGSTEITTDFGQRGCGLGLTGGQVIVVLNGSPFTTAGLARMIERAAAAAGLEIKAHPHMLRHAAVMRSPTRGTTPGRSRDGWVRSSAGRGIAYICDDRNHVKRAR